MIRVSYIICTRNRPRELADTVRDLDALHAQAPDQAEIIIADNASDSPIVSELPSTTVPVRVISLTTNMGAAARNHAAAHAQHPWLVMLDDDSSPKDLGHLHALGRVSEDTAALMADITLPDGSREHGGLPEVFIGCGVAIRKTAFIEAGGYDPSFLYYAEEHDLCARLIAAGWRIEMSPWFRVLHRKTTTGRDLNAMLRLVTRNTGVVIERYAPPSERSSLRKEHLRRCVHIAQKENAHIGVGLGIAELRAWRGSIRRSPMPPHLHDRLTGLHHARLGVEQAIDREPFATACLTHKGKHAWAVHRALTEAGIEVIDSPLHAERLVIATMSPGPMLDAVVELHAVGVGYRTIAPWTQAHGLAGLEGDTFPLMPSLVNPAPAPAMAAEVPARSKIRA